jgi:hypothetical protein
MRARHVTRSDLRRALALNALSKPVNVLAPSAVLVAALLIGAWWLALVALAVWLVLATGTFFDVREAERVGARARARRRPKRPDAGELTPLIAGRLKAAERVRTAIHEAIGSSAVPLDDVAGEVDALVDAIAADAARAQRMHRYLLGQEPADALDRRIASEPNAELRAALEAKRDALGGLRRRFGALLSELDRAIAALETMQAQILETGDRALAELQLAGQVSELRARVELVSAGLEEAFSETRARQDP